jgi:Lipase (class 3)
VVGKISIGVAKALHKTRLGLSPKTSDLGEPTDRVCFAKGEFPHATLERMTGFSEDAFEDQLEALESVDFGRFESGSKVSADNAYILAASAALVYESPAAQRDFLSTQTAVKGFTFLDSVDNERLGIEAPDTGTQVSLYETEDAVIVSTRGTVFATEGPGFFDREWQDFLNNINTMPVDNYDDSAVVHAGFKEAADGIWTQLRPHLLKAKRAGKALHLTGHSLGASVATHLADRMNLELGKKPTSLITFGGPAVGWSGQKKHLESTGLGDRTLRFAASGDPTIWSVPGGRHAGPEAYFDRHRELTRGEGWNLKDRFMASTIDNISQRRHPIEHHHPLNYCGLVRENRDILEQWAHSSAG